MQFRAVKVTTFGGKVAVTGGLRARWYAVVNDLIGGWSVATADKPVGDLCADAGEFEIADVAGGEVVALHIADAHNASLGEET